MPQRNAPPDAFFIAEFGTGELSSRLWRGGLRATIDHYSLQQGVMPLTNALKDALDVRTTEQAILNIVSDLETCWNDTARMSRACSPLSSQSASGSVLSVSLVKLLLGIDLFQTPLITCIINKISELADQSSSDHHIALVLLNQLRWLHSIVDGAGLCQSLLSIVPVISPPMQKNLIEALPEILDDSSRETAVSELLRIMEDSPSMMGSVVDALSALGADDNRLPEINNAIISTLAAANRDVLPVSIKYLLRTCPQSLLPETVREIRSTLALPTLGATQGRLCLDALKSGLRMSKLVTEHMIKTLKNISDPLQHKPADFWILIAMFDSPLHRKSAEVLFRKKAASNVFSKHLLDAAIAPFAEAFDGITDRLIEMASIALKSSEVGARKTGVLLYALLFRLFPSGSTRKNVVTGLLNHTGTRQPAEMDASLEALALIAKEAEQDRSLMPHSASIQGLLDFLEVFTDPQLRQIWTILGYLCRASAGNSASSSQITEGGRRKSADSVQELDLDDGDGESELAMLQILLRKELTHSEMFYRRIGVIGACTMLKTLGNVVKNGILNMLLEVGRSHSFTQAIVFDELAHAFHKEDPSTKETAETIRKTISSHFEKRYTADKEGLDSLIQKEGLLPATFYGNLEGPDADFCISVAKHIRNGTTLKRSQDAVRAMIPNLRLLCVLTASRHDGSLSEIDGIIGAPLHVPTLPRDQDMDELNMTAKGDLLLSLFIAHGWTVELINGFAEQSGAELRAKCIKRLDNLLDLTGQISSVVSQLPAWSEVLFDLYNGTRTFAIGTTPGSTGSSSKRGRKKSSGTENRPSSNNGNRASTEWKKNARQLAPSALSLIRVTTPVSWRLTETESGGLPGGNPSVETVRLSSNGLEFLLSELFLHVNGLIGTNVRDQNLFGVSMFRYMGGTAAKSDENRGSVEAVADGVLHRFQELRTPLTSLGQQLSRCLAKIFPGENDLMNDDDDASLEVQRHCTMLTLKCLARCLNSAVLSEMSGQRLLFDILASIQLDDSPSPEASDPFTLGDVQCAAKFAFEQLRKQLAKIFPAEEEEEDDEDRPIVDRGRDRKRRPSDLQLEGCCAFLAAMDGVFMHCSEGCRETLKPKFSQVAHKLLEYTWDNTTLRARKTQKMLPGIVKIYVQYSANALDTADDLKEKLVKLSDKQEAASRRAIDTQHGVATQDNDLASLAEQTSYAFTIATLEQYLWLFKTFQPQRYESTEEAFETMERLMKAELPLYNLARQNQEVLGPVMKAGRTMVDMFVKSCVPFLKEKFREHRSKVVQLCKMHQKPTRILQTFCAHSKSIRDTSLTGLVPPLRKSLELLLYKVKELLQVHNAMGAFQMGNLKHRDINGEVLSSQHLQYKSESDGESEYSSADEAGEGDNNEGAVAGNAGRGSQRRGLARSISAIDRPGRPKNNERGKKKRKLNNAGSKQGKGVQRSKVGSQGGQGGEEGDDDKVIAETSGARGVARGSLAEVDSQRRHPLIDDEAGEEEEDGAEDGAADVAADLSQFLVFGDEEEEEE